MEWISVTDRLPTLAETWHDHVEVLAYDSYYGPVAASYCKTRGWELPEGLHSVNVTHWMPLPAPPED